MNHINLFVYLAVAAICLIGVFGGLVPKLREPYDGQVRPAQDGTPLFYENWANGLTIEQMWEKINAHKDEFHAWYSANPKARHFND